MKPARQRFMSRGSWKDPEKVGVYLLVCVVYVLGLLAFHKSTGLMDLKRTAHKAPTDQHVWSSQDAQTWLAMYGRSKRDVEQTVSGDNPSPLFRHLLSANVSGLNGTSSYGSGNGTNETEKVKVAEPPTPLFPPDIFTHEQLKQGGVILYMMGMMYMFVALAIVCDEFFVPSLDVIIEVIGCSEDVAGATFMAAGGSAPELFTSVIGVFISFSDVGIGTIVGSAVFNILFVIGMCALFSKTVLHLTWWPLFRDCTFYSFSLITLILFFLDEKISMWESALQLGVYAAYVIFMKFNAQSERFVKKLLNKNKVTRVRSTDHLVPSHHSAAAMLAGVTGAAMSGVVASEGGRRNQSSIPVLHSGSHFRHGLLQLMIHTIDPLNDGKVDEKATQLHAIASLKVLLDATKPQDGVNGTTNPNDGTITGIADMGHDSGRASQGTEEEVRIAGAGGLPGADGEIHDEVQPEPLDMAFPKKGLRKQITYLILFPIIFPLWLTLPDTRSQKARKFFPITFSGSILWIAIFSYLMVWFSTVAGDTFGIPPEVMGLTFLAAGTSIPDLITSVIVARKGFGDMAVSSSVGSNIFDVTVGLPLPWFLYSCVFNEAVPVSSDGMVCSITLLFTMLVLVFFSILIFGWKMTKGMGMSMFVFYFIFVAISLGFEYKFLSCPI